MSSFSIAILPALPISSSLFFFGRPILLPPEVWPSNVLVHSYRSAKTLLDNNGFICIYIFCVDIHVRPDIIYNFYHKEGIVRLMEEKTPI